MKVFLISFCFLLIQANPVIAEVYGTPPAPTSLAPDQSRSLDGTGVRMINQGCQYGGQRAASTYVDDTMLKEIRRGLNDNGRIKSEFEKKAYNLDNALSKSKEELAKLLGAEDLENFVSKAGQCSAAFIEHKRSTAQDAFKVFENNEFFGKCENPTSENFSQCNADAARCKRAFDRSQGAFDIKHMCYGVTPNDGKNANYKKGENYKLGQIDSLNSEWKVAKCGRLVVDIMKKQAEAEKLAKQIADKEEREEKLKSKLEEEQDRYNDRLAEAKELGLDRVTADGAGVRDCPSGDGECLILKAQQMRSDNTGKWLFAGAMADSLINAFVNVNTARRNANLGYPTGPNPFISPIVGVLQSYVAYSALDQMRMNMGYPFNYGGVYGGTQGGTGAGTWGCSPSMYGSQPYSFGPAGSPYGNLFNNGFIPGYGPTGPGYMNGGAATNPFALQCLMSGANCGGLGGINSILNGLANPYGQLGLNNQANMFGYPGSIYSGSPFLNGMLGNQFGNQFGGPGSMYGNQFGGPGSMYGNQFGGNPQMQMQYMNQQMQQMAMQQAALQSEMQRIFDENQRRMQAMQLMQQAYSIYPGVGGVGANSGNIFGASAGINIGVNPLYGTQYQAPIAGSMNCISYPCNPGLSGNPGNSNR